MTITVRFIFHLFGVLLAVAASPLWAQVVPDGATNTLSNTTNTFAGDVTVGTNGAFTLLILSDHVLLTNSAHGFISRQFPARSNEVRLLGASARWLMGSNLFVGSNGSFGRLVVGNGALVGNHDGEIGRSTPSNQVLVTGPGSVWSNASDLLIGRSGSANLLVVSNGGTVRSERSLFAISSSASNNMAVVTGPGSRWNTGHISLGEDGHGNRLVVSDGGVVQGSAGYLGAGVPSRDNVAIVTGSGSVWSNASEFSVGNQGAGNLVVVSNGGAVLAHNFVTLGAHPTSLSNRMVIDGGSLRSSNTFSLGTGVLDVRRGRAVLNAGLIEVNHLRMTNAQGIFEFNGGTLSVRNSTFANGQLFRVGDGVSPATMHLAGNGRHQFSGVLAVIISSNATLSGNGTITNPGLQFADGSLLAPGAPGVSIGKMIFSQSPTLQGATHLELSKSGALRTNDQLEVTGPLDYGGSLSVNHLGPTALAAGDRFQLFVAGSYTGSFSSLSLPPLNPGLDWRNTLLVDGSVAVVAAGPPGFASITRSGTNMILNATNGTPGASYALLTTTNVTLPVSQWVSIATNQFGGNGGFSFTNGILPGEIQRYFRLRTP